MTALKYIGDKVGTALGRAVAFTRPKNGEANAHGGAPKGSEGGTRA